MYTSVFNGHVFVLDTEYHRFHFAWCGGCSAASLGSVCVATHKHRARLCFVFEREGIHAQAQLWPFATVHAAKEKMRSCCLLALSTS